MYFQLSNKRAEWNKRAGWAESFIYDLKKLEQVWQNFRLLHEKRGTGFSDMDAGHLTLFGVFRFFPLVPHETMKIKVV